MKQTIKQVLGIALFAAVLFVGGCTTIPPGSVGIIVNKWGQNRGVQDYTTTTGFVTYNPVSTDVVEFPTSAQTIKWTQNPDEGGLNDNSHETTDESITFLTNKGTSINGDVSLTFQLDPKLIPTFYVKFRQSATVESFAYGFLHNTVRNAMTEIGSRYSVEDVMGGKTEEFVKSVATRVQQEVAPLGVQIEQFGIIGKLRPPIEIQNAITAANQAQYLAQQKQNELLQSQADAAKRVADAKGQADAAIEVARGQAQSNKLINESLTDKVLERTRLDVEWYRISKWNGQLPQVTTSGGNGMLLNIPSKP